MLEAVSRRRPAVGAMAGSVVAAAVLLGLALGVWLAAALARWAAAQPDQTKPDLYELPQDLPMSRDEGSSWATGSSARPY